MHVQAFVENTAVWGDGAPFAGRHAARSERVPCCFDVALNFESHNQNLYEWCHGFLALTPFLNVFNVLLAVLQGFSGFVFVGVEVCFSWRFSWLQLVGPGSFS